MRLVLAVSLAALFGCGGGGSAQPETPRVETPKAVAEFTTIDLNTIDNYARPTLPAHFNRQVLADDNSPETNRLEDKIATLGRVLFYDKRLSTNDTVACASCHRQSNGFTDSQRFSKGVDGSTLTSAHSMRLANLRFFKPGSMFWNRRATSVEALVSEPLQAPSEMGWDSAAGGMPALLTKMRSLSYYPPLFAFAFGDGSISEQRVQNALAQFLRAMVSYNSRWDIGYAQIYKPDKDERLLLMENLPNLTEQENTGRMRFMARGVNNMGLGCAECHVPPTFGLVADSKSNGLDPDETTVFKVPSLRNAAITGPYMHDGRFATLVEAIRHYQSPKMGPALDRRLKKAILIPESPFSANLVPTGFEVPQGIGFGGEADIEAIAAFLATLTDSTLLTDPRFSDPFRR